MPGPRDLPLTRRRFLALAAATAACGRGEPRVAPAAGATIAGTKAAPSGDDVAADLLVTGGKVWTGDTRAPWAEAVAIRGDTIQAVGSAANLAPLRGPRTRVLDLAGGLAVPGLTDAHGHVLGLGRSLEEVDLRGAASIEEVVARLRDAAPPAGWITGRGWDQNLWPGGAMPTHEPLTEAFGDRPVWLRRVDGHAGWGNAALLRRAGIGPDTRAPGGGEILRDPSGAPTGVLVDAAMDLVDPPAPTAADRRRWVQAALARLAELGLTGVHDMGVGPEDDALYRELAAADGPAGAPALTARIHGYAHARWFEEELLDARGPDHVGKDTRYALVGAKLYADGALGSRGAYLLRPYSDRRGHRGLLQRKPKALARLATRAFAQGWQLATHAIGDGAIRATLDAYEAGLQRHRDPRLRPRIEHAQIVDPTDIPRFSHAGILASMQPTHATSDMPWVPARIGPSRLPGAYAWRRFLASGVHLCFGSDFPVELPNVTHGLYAAITRQDAQGRPPGGWLPDQRLSLEEALAAFSREPAYAVGREDHLGVLRPEALADLTCFQRDLTNVEPREVREAAVLATVVGGRVVHQA